MYRIIKTMNGEQTQCDFDTEKEAITYRNMISKWKHVSGVETIHYIRPIKPSLAPVKGSSGYRRDIFTGWKNIESSTIFHRDFTVTFECYGEADIDTFCDALNGWYTTWTEWRATYRTKGETIQVTTHKRDVIDHLFEAIVNVGPDSDPEYSEEELVRSYFQRIVASKKPG